MELTENQMQRIRNGAALLDWWMPGWQMSIKPLQLDVNSFSSCILCQLYGNFYTGLEALGLQERGEGGSQDYGFYPHPEDQIYDLEEMVMIVQAKNKYWLDQVTSRIKS